jgi:methionine biosynthesis protein MetW
MAPHRTSSTPPTPVPGRTDLARTLLHEMDPALGRISDQEIESLLERWRHPPGAVAVERAARWQDRIIESQIAQGSAVLDLGCGDGQLLARLMRGRRVRGQGIELDADAVLQCVTNGVPVFQSNLDEGLKGFSDGSFDYVVLEETLQTLHRPIEVLQDMLRVGRRGIVSFPNFGFWQVRLDLALRGRMPVTEYLPYRWYDTPNIHLFCLQDFLDWTQSAGVRIVEAHVLTDDQQVRPMRDGDNLYAQEVLCIVERA